MFRNLFLVGCLYLLCQLPATHARGLSQNGLKDSISLTLEQTEALFIQNNLKLLTERLNIDIADANIIQAKLWPNPEITLDNLNFWVYKEQREPGNALGSLIGKRGNYQQFALQIEQLVETAGKRSKRIKLAVLSRAIAQKDYEILLIDLKHGVRTTYLELHQEQTLYTVIVDQITATKQFLTNVQAQVLTGNIIKAEALRIQSLLVDLQISLTKQTQRIQSLEQELNVYLNLPELKYIKTTALHVDSIQQQINTISLASVIEAMEQNAGIQLAKLEVETATQVLNVEKANRTPDLNIMSSYDRGGGIVRNYVGFGVKVILPVFNKNQAPIKSAALQEAKLQLILQQKKQSMHAQIVNTWGTLQIAAASMKNFSAAFQSDMDEMLLAHTQMYKKRTITLYQWIDVYNVWLNNKIAGIESTANLNNTWEALQYETGYTIK